MNSRLMQNDLRNVRYFIQRTDPGDVRVAVYRMRMHMDRWQAHYWDWRDGNWHEKEDILRRYWKGFDADVDEVTAQEALGTIQDREKLDG